MKQQVKRLSAALLLPFLMSATTVTTDYSNMLNYQVKGKVVLSKSSTEEVKSSRGSLMGKVVFNYEVICNGHPDYTNIHRPTRRYYTVNYRMDLYPQNGVKYANGLGGWFTETGNAAVYGATVKTSIYNSDGIQNASQAFKHNLAFTGESTDGAYIYSLCHPSENKRYFRTELEGAIAFQHTEKSIKNNDMATTVKDDCKIKASDIDSDPKVDSASKVVSSADNIFNFVGRPRKIDTEKEKREYVSVYGSYKFTSDNANDKIQFAYTGTFIVAENSFWGDEAKHIQNTITVNWQRPDTFD